MLAGHPRPNSMGSDWALIRWDNHLRPAVTLTCKRQRTDALAGDRKDRVGDRRNHRRQARLAKTGGRIIRLQEEDVDIRRSLRQTQRWILVEIALHGSAALDGDLITHGVAHSFDHRALCDVLSGPGIDHLAADIADDPGLVDLHAGAFGHG